LFRHAKLRMLQLESHSFRAIAEAMRLRNTLLWNIATQCKNIIFFCIEAKLTALDPQVTTADNGLLPGQRQKRSISIRDRILPVNSSQQGLPTLKASDTRDTLRDKGVRRNVLDGNKTLPDPRDTFQSCPPHASPASQDLGQRRE
jgi:hypothetical protein